jgi:hypothetical protein
MLVRRAYQPHSSKLLPLQLRPVSAQGDPKLGSYPGMASSVSAKIYLTVARESMRLGRPTHTPSRVSWEAASFEAISIRNG